jgi:hypothetical protein
MQIWAYIDIFHHLVWFAIAGSILTISLGYTIIHFTKTNDRSEEYNCFTAATLTTLFPLHLILGLGIGSQKRDMFEYWFDDQYPREPL